MLGSEGTYIHGGALRGPEEIAFHSEQVQSFAFGIE